MHLRRRIRRAERSAPRAVEVWLDSLSREQLAALRCNVSPELIGVDLASLTHTQLERLANGEEVTAVLGEIAKG
jgi:hypothetical protein